MRSLKSKPPSSESANKSKTWSDAEQGNFEPRCVAHETPDPAIGVLDPDSDFIDPSDDQHDFRASRQVARTSTAMIAAKPGKLVLISGPSGVGKSTVVRQVLGRVGSAIRLSVSATTRPPRPGEQEAVDYYFLSDAEFTRRREAGEFLECVEVFGRGHWYGTLWSEVRSSLSQGKWVILEIDVDGAAEVLRQYPEAVTIFIRPDSVEELERRLRARATESEEAVQRRLAVARHELQLSDQYEHQIVNVTVDAAVDEVCQLLRDHGLPQEPAAETERVQRSANP